MAISSIGVGSGLPIEELLKDLRASENQPLVQLQSQQVQAQSRLSAYGTLRGSVEALNTAAKALGKADTFGALKASTAGDAFTASVSNKAVAGQYNIKVTGLAKSQTLVTEGVADRTAAIGNSGGTLSVTINGEVKTLDIAGANGSGPSLNDVVASINGDASLGFSATLVNDGSGTPHRLLLTSKETGTDAAIESLSFAATDTGSEELNNLIAFTAGGSNPNITEDAAVNAKIFINTIEITSQSNTVEGAIEGVTLNLLKEDATGTNLAITRDDSVTAKAINTFVEAYNSLSNTIKSLTSYDVENQKGSALTGDNLARNLQNQMRQALNAVTGSGDSLWELGISSNATTGLLEVDTDKLNAALKADMGKAEKIFAGENGISSQINKVADSFVSSNGFFKSAEEGINSTIKILDQQYAATSTRIDAKMEQYRQQFSQLDVMMSQMNGISSYLTQQLSMLSNIGKEK